jgi:hypothetical protein
MIGQGLLFRKTWDIAEILRYFEIYCYIEIAREISILLSIYQKIFGTIVIVINIEIPNMAQLTKNIPSALLCAFQL